MPGIVSNTIQAHGVRFNKYTCENEFIVLKRSSASYIYPSLWQVITGRIEHGESAINTAARELKEETGLGFNKIWAIPYITKYYNYRNDTICFSPVFGFLINADDNVRLSEEHEEFEWLNYENAMDRLVLQGHKEGLKIFSSIVLNCDSDIYRLEL